jgi:hypothetical protein
MREDYGDIEVVLPQGLSRESRVDLAKRQIQNQLLISDQIRYVYVHAQCLDFVKILEDGKNFEFYCNGFFYSYYLRILYTEDKELKMCVSCK